MAELVHAVALAVALDADGPLAGALLFGRSGAGKSSLALYLIETCRQRRTALISDDAVLLDAEPGGRLRACAPKPIAGLIEIRGFGVAPVRASPAATLMAGFDLAADGARLPEPSPRSLAGARLPCWPLVASDLALAAIRLRVILRAILARNSAAAGVGGAPKEDS